MGLDPDDDNYAFALPCLTCNDPLFNGFTPEKVLANFQGITTCPGKFPPNSAPNRTFVLTQTFACIWQVIEAGYTVRWDLSGTGSILSVRTAMPFWFFGIDVNPCIDAFTNSLFCVALNSWSSTGTGKVFWGPQIGKQPI